MKKLLHLGRVDEGVSLSEAEKRQFLALYHHAHGFSRRELRFRDDSRNLWREWEKVEGNRVRELTTFLQSAGFMPGAAHDGIFGYVTQAAVRLFQEYVRTIAFPEAHSHRAPACWPDGVVGRDTEAYIERWQREQLHCRWGVADPTEDYAGWLRWLTAAKAHYREQPTSLQRALIGAADRGDSLVPADWTFEPGETHLLGIRRGVDRVTDAGRRPPDDLLILLLNGRTFYFAGSTDANPREGREGYLIEGQHRYRLDWHNVGLHRRDRIYKAARPATNGVMVARDVHGHNALSEANRRDGFDPRPNPTFNIHWNGLGISNWSAGCQVVSGRSYLNDSGEPIDCTAFAARNDVERGRRRSPGGPRLTMGAYTLLSDLVLCYTPQGDPGKKPTFRYTLFDEAALAEVPGTPPTDVAKVLERLAAAPLT